VATADVQRTALAHLRVERVARFEGDVWTYRFLPERPTRALPSTSTARAWFGCDVHATSFPRTRATDVRLPR
jgi:hypothetical protein